MIEADGLKQVPIFACLTDAQRVRFAHTAAELHVQDGEWLIREGEAPWFFRRRKHGTTVQRTVMRGCTAKKVRSIDACSLKVFRIHAGML